MLNTRSPIPLYHQLADILLAGIRSGDYPPGSRIPSEPQLVKDFGIGRPTVRQAIDVLVRKRLLTRRRGSGTYVNPRAQAVDLFSFGGTSAAFHKQGLVVDVQVRQPPTRIQVADDLENPFAGATAFFFSRVSRVDGAPVLLEEIYLHAQHFDGIERIDLVGRSLSQVAETRFSMRPVAGRQTFRIGYLDGEKARIMAVTVQTPILEVRRSLGFIQAGDAVFSILYCITEPFVFSQQIGGLQHE